MSPRVWVAVACLVIGIPLAAWALANKMILLGLLGLALVLVFIFLVVDAMSRAERPQHEIPKSAQAVWTMKDAPPGPPSGRREGGSL
jgi:membrane protein implicated in regulation of membrane protease activity